RPGARGPQTELQGGQGRPAVSSQAEPVRGPRVDRPGGSHHPAGQNDIQRRPGHRHGRRQAGQTIMNQKLGLTRNIIKPNYALITPDGHVASVLPGWTNCVVNVLISAALGARLSQYLITLEANGIGMGDTGHHEWFCYVVSGSTK